MLLRIKTAFYNTFFKKEYENLIQKLDRQQQTIKSQNTKIQLYEEMLANKNAATTIAQTIYVTDHAVHRYIERVDKFINPSEAKRLIYKRTLALLTTMDRLPDGKYNITNNATIRIKDNTVCTVTRRK